MLNRRYLVGVAFCLAHCLLGYSGSITANAQRVNAELDRLRIRQTSTGVLQGWMALGPYATGELEDLNMPVESAAVIGSTVGDRRWIYLPTSDQGILDLQVLGGGADVTGFAACVIDAKKPTPAVLLLGSDDGARVWLDGKLVHEALGPRSLQIDQDRIALELPDRPITLVIQVLQGNGDWSLAGRLTTHQGEPLLVDCYCPVLKGTVAAIVPNWDVENRRLVVHCSSFTRASDAVLRLESSKHGVLQEEIQLPRDGQLTSHEFLLPWASQISEPVAVQVELTSGEQTLASTNLTLWPQFVPDRAWIDSSDAVEDVWRLHRRVALHPKLVDAFIGNGYYGIRLSPTGTTAPFPDARTHVGGIYEKGERVAHPRWAAVDLQVAGMPYRPEGEQSAYRQTLDMKKCRLTTTDRWSTPEGNLEFKLEVLPHRTRPNLLLMRYRLEANVDMTVELLDTLDSSGIEGRSDETVITGEVNSISYRKESIELTEKVASLWGLPDSASTSNSRREGAVSKQITVKLAAQQPVMLERYAVLQTTIEEEPTVDDVQAVLRDAAATGFDALAKEHEQAWRNIWSSDIVVPNSRLQQLIHASLFDCYCSLREDYPCSISPTGLSSNAWGGRVFWDADLWVFPPLALLQPKIARSIVEYRHNTLEGARHDARVEDRKGAKWAWESARSGRERCPWPPAIEQRHIQNDVAYAQHLYCLCSGDTDYQKEKALPVVLASANYWVDRVTYNEQADRYEIHGVLGADEYAENIDNNLTTNYGAAVTLRLAHNMSQTYKQNSNPMWLEIADKMYLPFDESQQLFLQHDRYRGDQIKQADTSLSIYPWEMEMPEELKANLLSYYPARRPPTPIMMSSAIYCIAFAEIGRKGESTEYFNELIPYFWFPTLLASESQNRTTLPAAGTTMSFATGKGGFLQAVINGFAGVRVRNDGLMIDPKLPDFLPWIELRGMHFNGLPVDCRIDEEGVRIAAPSTPSFRIYDREGHDYEVVTPPASP